MLLKTINILMFAQKYNYTFKHLLDNSNTILVLQNIILKNIIKYVNNKSMLLFQQ